MLLKISLALFATALTTAAFFAPSKPSALPVETTPIETAVSGNGNNNPEELGNVNWSRDLEAGKAESAKTGKPLLILFQEVPGCSNCTTFGNATLKHPLIVEAIETYFVPVCIYNNKGGKDAEALKIFDEPAWNNPVIRIVRADYKDVVLRMPDFRSSLPIVNGMRRALELTGTAVPAYLELLEQEFQAKAAGTQTVTYSMYCFWSGECTLGAVNGIIATTPGYQDGKEVVRIEYNAAVLSRTALDAIATQNSMTASANNDGFRPDKDLKYYLAHTSYKSVPMTSLQACRANSTQCNDASPETVLSPRQIALAKKAQEHPEKNFKNVIGRGDLAKAWEESGE